MKKLAVFIAAPILALCVLAPVSAKTTTQYAESATTDQDVLSGPVVNLTDTPDGEALLNDALDSTALEPEADYQVLTNVPGDADDAVWIVPAGDPVPVVEIDPNGLGYSAELTMEPPAFEEEMLEESSRLTSRRSLRATDNGIEEPIEPVDCPEGVECRPGKRLVWSSNTCHARYDEKTAWMDRCSTWGKVKRDGDPSWDHWAFKQFATCKSAESFALRSCTLAQIKADNTITRYWEDWAPKSDKSADQPCSQVSIGLSYFGVSVGGSFNACERIDITKYEEGARFKAEWTDGNSSWVINSEREIAYRVAWRQNQNSTATLKTSWDVLAHCVGCG